MASSRLVLSPCSRAVLTTRVRAAHCHAGLPAPRLPLPPAPLPTAHCPPGGMSAPLQTCLQAPRLAWPPSSRAWWGLPGQRPHQPRPRKMLSTAPSSDRASGALLQGPPGLPCCQPGQGLILPRTPASAGPGLRLPQALCPPCQAQGTYRCARLVGVIPSLSDPHPWAPLFCGGRAQPGLWPAFVHGAGARLARAGVWRGLTARPAAGLPGPGAARP